MLTFTIPGRPLPQRRPIVLKRGWTIDPTESRTQKKMIALLAMAAKSKARFKTLKGPVGVRLVFIGADPRSDIDNLVKLVLDALKGIAWEDDRQIIHLIAHKLECDGDEPHTLVEIQDGGIED